jgi:S1-C subfamily serine protease
MDGEKVLGKVIASEPSADVALLRLSSVPASAVPAALGDSDAASIGDAIFIIGAPYGISHVLTAGYISARHSPNMVIKNFEIGEFFQTDAAINEGNSGGPMFNMKGEVIGIVSSIFTRSGGFEGIGFAATSNTARKVLLDDPTPWSGVDGYLLAGDLARAFNLPQPEGMLIQRVAIGSPAYRAGIRGGTMEAMIDEDILIIGGDIVLSVQGIQVSSDPRVIGGIKEAIKKVPRNGEIRLSVLRGGERLELAAVRSK